MSKPTYLIVALLEDAPTAEFDIWPFHMTLAPWFEVNKKGLVACFSKIEELLIEVGPLTIKATHTSHFGDNEEFTVTEVTDVSNELDTLHLRLVKTVQENMGIFTNLKYALGNFKPHVSVKPNGNHMPMDSPYICNNVAIMERVSDTDYRSKLVKLVRLN